MEPEKEQEGLSLFLNLPQGERIRLCGLFREMLGEAEAWEQAAADRDEKITGYSELGRQVDEMYAKGASERRLREQRARG
jgi:hypothetical protein